MSATLPLSNGGVALIEAADFEATSRHVWHRDTQGYPRAMVKVGGRWRLVRLHRFLLAPVPGQEVDHRNGDKLDNRRANLRFCTRGENATNLAKRQRTTSRFKGVSWHKAAGKWAASIAAGGQKFYLGLFVDEGDAHRAYLAAAAYLHGAFMREESAA